MGFVLAVLFLGATFKPVVEGDGVSYYSYLHTVLVDHDLDLAEEYQAAFSAHVTVNSEHLSTRTATGLVANYFPVGPALAAAPVYALGLVAHPDGRPLFGPPFTTLFALASLLYGLIALGLAWNLMLCAQLSRRAAWTGLAAAALATPYAYYLLYEPSYSHTFSACAVTFFVWLWWKRRKSGQPLSTTFYGVLGLAAGLMASVRFQDGLLAAVLLVDLPLARWRLLAMLPGALVGFAPQIAVDRVLFGTWLPVRPSGQELSAWPGHYLQVLFSTWHGYVTWSPVVLPAAAGMLFLRRRQRPLAIAAAIAFAVELAIAGSAPDWWGGYAFGARRLLDLTPFVALGAGALAERFGRPVVIVVGALAAWTAVLVANLTYVIRSDHDPGLGGLLAGQLTALAYVPRLFVQGHALRDPLGAGPALLLAEALCLAVAVTVVAPRAVFRLLRRS